MNRHVWVQLVTVASSIHSSFLYRVTLLGQSDNRYCRHRSLRGQRETDQTQYEKTLHKTILILSSVINFRRVLILYI